MASEVEEIEAILREHVFATHGTTPCGQYTDYEVVELGGVSEGAQAIASYIAALRSKDREDGAREMREPQSKAVVFRQLTDEERHARAKALAQAYRDERAAVWPAGCLKPNSCARHSGCMYAQSSLQCRHYGLDLTEAVARAEAALPLTTRTEDGHA